MNKLNNYIKLFFYYSGGLFIWRKFVPEKGSNKLPTGVLWILGLYFAAYAFTTQRYEAHLERIEFRYNTFTSQMAAGMKFSNGLLMGILNEKIPLKASIYSPISILKSFFYGPCFNFFYQVNKDQKHHFYQSAEDFRQEIIAQWRNRLRGADFRNAQFKKAFFYGGQLEQADFTNAILEGGDFRFAELNGAKFVGAKLNGAKFNYAQMENATLTGAHLNVANFTGAQLNGANFGVLLADLVDGELYSVGAIPYERDSEFATKEILRCESFGSGSYDLVSTPLNGAIFDKANLRGAIFTLAQLKDATFKKAKLQGADFTKVKKLKAIELIKAIDISGIKKCPQKIIDELQLNNCYEMLTTPPDNWSEKLKISRDILISPKPQG